MTAAVLGEPRGRVRWGLCGVVVVALHAALGLATVTWIDPPPEPPPALAAVVIDLAPLAAPPAPPVDVAPGPEQIESEPTRPRLVPQPLPVEPPPIEQLRPDPVRLPEPPPPEPELVEPEPEPVVQVAVRTLPQRIPQPEPEPEPLPEPEVVLPPVPAVPPPPPPPEVAEVEPVERPAPQPQMAVPTTSAPPEVQAPEAVVAAAPVRADDSAVMASVMPSFEQILLAHLERHRRYPPRARKRHQEGTATLRFVMDSDGRVLSFRLERSSGFELLDDEVLEMIRRAEPLPPIPEELGRDQLELVVPVRFVLK